MQFTKNTLLNDEKIIFNTSPHPIVFATAFIAYLISLLFYLNLYHVLDSSMIVMGKAVNDWAALIAFLFAIVLTISALITYKTSEYAVTNKRVLMKTGLIQRYSVELFLDKIEAIYVDQTILGRIINYGVIVVVGTGGSKDLFTNVPNPLEFRRKVQQQIDTYTHHKNQ